MIEPEEGDHSSDEDFSPGHLVIDMQDEYEPTGSMGRPTIQQSSSSSNISIADRGQTY